MTTIIVDNSGWVELPDAATKIKNSSNFLGWLAYSDEEPTYTPAIGVYGIMMVPDVEHKLTPNVKVWLRSNSKWKVSFDYE